MTKSTKFPEFVSSMTDEQLDDYAGRCGTTRKYMLTHLACGRKVPRRDLMVRLVREARGGFSRGDVLDHFYPPDEFDSDDAPLSDSQSGISP